MVCKVLPSLNGLNILTIILTGGKPFVATMLLAAITERLGQSLSWLLKTLVTKSNPILRLVTILNEALFIFPVED